MKATRKPLVSVLLPIGKNREYIDAALKSVESQTYRNIELLAEEDRREGITKLLIKLAEKAKGTFLARMDADDVSEPDRFRTQVRYLQQHAETQLVGSWAFLIDENGKKNGIRTCPTDWEEIKRQVFLRNPFIHPTWMMRRSWYEHIGGYNPKYQFSQDWELLLRTAWKSRIENIPRPLLQYRIHQKSISFSSNKGQLYCGLRAQLATITRGDAAPWMGIYLLPKIGSFFIPASLKFYLKGV